MRLLLTILFMGLVGVFIVPSLTEARCSSTRPIRRVYVVRRSLSLVKFFSWCAIAHSGLILEMRDGKQCVLEYMGDGSAHLYDARPTSTRNCWIKSCVKLVMKDDSGAKYDWTRQKYGTSTTGYYRAGISPQRAQQQMQSLMGHHYDLITNNCHLGQERLRRSWGMPVGQPYRPDIRGVCSCNLPGYLPGNLGTFLSLVKNYCRLIG